MHIASMYLEMVRRLSSYLSESSFMVTLPLFSSVIKIPNKIPTFMPKTPKKLNPTKIL